MEALNAVPQGGAPKEGFDLTHFQYFTSKAGQFGVVDAIDLIPDSDYRIAIDAYTRTMPNNTANFSHLKENYYFMFVPYGIISRNAYQMLVNRKEDYTALDMNISQFPTFNLGEVVEYAISMAKETMDDHPDAYDLHGFNIGCGAIRLLSMLGYGDFTDIMLAYINGVIDYAALHNICTNVDDETGTPLGLNRYNPTATRLCAYQSCWYHYFRNDVYDLNISPKCFNLDDITYGSNPSMNILDHRLKRDFIKQCCQLRYIPWKKDLFTASLPGTQFGAVSSVSLKSDLVSYGPTNVGGDITSNDAGRWNVPNTITTFGSDPGNLMYNGAKNFDVANVGSALHDHSIPSMTMQVNAGTSLFDVLQLVESQAIQKWRQKSLLAGNRTVDQWRAHYGVVPRHLIEHRPDFIGSVDNKIEIQQVVSMADTAGEGMTNLGDMAGRGYGASDDKVFNYHSNDYGVLLVLRAVVPEALYPSFGLDRANQKVYYTDFYHSEFQNIGLEAVPLINFDVCAMNSVNTPPSGGADTSTSSLNPYNNMPDGINGYAPRNYDHKQILSKVHGLFNPNRLLISKVNVPISQLPDQDWAHWIHEDAPYGFADMQSFVDCRTDAHSVIELRYENVGTADEPEWQFVSRVANYLYPEKDKLYVSPSVLNSLFAFDAGSDDTTDQFVTQARIFVKSVAPLTTLGLPQF